MKRGKDDEKMKGRQQQQPMFPRLHVNDAEKGGPRAPPRNKMALHEQLSIPSQRFNSNFSITKANGLVPSASSSQVSSYERNLHFPHHVPAPSHPTEKIHSRQYDGGNLNASSVGTELRKEVGDEDDFRVPVFFNSGVGQSLGKNQSGIDREGSTFGQNYVACSTKVQNAGDRNQKNSNSRISDLREKAIDLHENNLEVCVSSRDHVPRSFTSSPNKDTTSRPDDASDNQQNPDPPVSSFSGLHENGVCFQQGAAALLQNNDSGHGESVPELTNEINKGNVSEPISDYHSREDLSGLNEPEVDSEQNRESTYMLLEYENGNRNDDASETSMVDSASALEITPDGVVGIIGQKHFWKARRAIVKQQRLFSVQVFELHRLIKVQRLIAASPHLLLEECTYLGKPTVKVSAAKTIRAECVVTPAVHVTKNKDEFEKPNYRMECSADNAVGETPSPSVKNGSQTSNCGPYSGNPTPIPGSADPKMHPWCFPHPFGQQWLVPVMSPSEGLVYKPYPAPGMMGSGYGGWGPFGPTPLTGNFVNPKSVFTAAHHPHQGTMPIPAFSQFGHGYFPPYGMPGGNPTMSGSAVEQMNYFAWSGSQGQTGQLSGGGANYNMQHQSSCNVPTQKSRSIPQGTRFQPQVSKDTDLQGSTASSPSERVEGGGTSKASDRRDAIPALPLFPTASAAPEAVPRPQEAVQPRRAIRVVPHNQRSATESAVRIFQSIQEERKQYDSI